MIISPTPLPISLGVFPITLGVFEITLGVFEITLGVFENSKKSLTFAAANRKQ